MRGRLLEVNEDILINTSLLLKKVNYISLQKILLTELLNAGEVKHPFTVLQDRYLLLLLYLLMQNTMEANWPSTFLPVDISLAVFTTRCHRFFYLHVVFDSTTVWHHHQDYFLYPWAFLTLKA